MFKHIAILVPAAAKSFHTNAMTNTTVKTVTKRKTPACNGFAKSGGSVLRRHICG